ncbi:MAG TPA: SPFH domain-containing protein [Propionibacteriaceae bacterium]
MTNQPQFNQPTPQPAAAPAGSDQGYQPPAAAPVPYPDQEVAVPALGIVTATPVGHSGVRVAAEERDAWSVPGGLALLVLLAVGAVAIGFGVFGAVINAPMLTVLGVVLFIAMYFGMTSLTVIQPGESKVLQFLGRYVGTIRRPGLQLTMPFTSKRRVSVKVNNFETHELKVNDSDGNPVNIAAIIVWQIADTAKASFAVENSQHFVEVQAESALRHVASTHPYDNADPGEESLRGSTELVAAELAKEVAARVAIAGIEIVEARISSLAYAPEIAHAMLQRQQAAAVIAARSMIVEGAVGMVEQALRRLETDSVVQMNEERKAQMVANLLLVLCGDSRATPVINTNQ